MGRGESAVSLRQHGPARPDGGDVDVAGRVAGREGDRLRSSRRHLHDAVRGRRGEGADLRHSVGHAAAVFAGREVDRVHVRPLGRRQHLDHGAGREESAAGDEGELPAAEQPGVDAGLAVHRGAQALHGHAVAGRGRDLALSPHGRRGAADDQARDGAEGRRGAGVLARRALSLLVRGHDAGEDLGVQQGSERADLRHQAARARDGQDRQLRHRAGRVDPADAVAGREVARVRAAGSVQVGAVRQGPRVRRRAAGVRRARARHAGDVGDPGGLSRDGVDAGFEVGGVLGGRVHPAGGSRGEAGRRRSRSTSRTRGRPRRRCGFRWTC